MNEELHEPWISQGLNLPSVAHEILDVRGALVAAVSRASHARLISAAPDLLEACKAWIKLFDDLARDGDYEDPIAEARYQFHRERLEMTRTAIAKAEAPAPSRT